MFFEQSIRQFITHPLAANIFMGFLMLLGLYSYFSIPQEIFPEFRAPEIVIEAQLPGASVERIEKAVIVPIERAVNGERGITRLAAQASAGHASLHLEISRDHAMAEILATVKSRIDSIDTLPTELEGLTVTSRDDRTQLIWLHLTGRDIQDLLPVAEQLQDTLMLQDFISRVELLGAPNQELEIEVKPDALYAFGLTLEALAEQLSANNLDLDAGYLRETSTIGLTISEETTDTAQLANLPIQISAEQTILLGEIAELRLKGISPGTLSRFNGQDAIAFAIFRDRNTSPIQAVSELKTFLKTVEQELANDLTLSLWLDESRELSARLNLLASNGVFGIALVMIVLLVFTHWRIALWVSAGLPVTYLAALWGMSLPGVDLTLNVITFFGFLIVSGILVDDALVVGESIHQEYLRLNQTSSPPQDNSTLPSQDRHQHIAHATLTGLKKVSVPAVFGVLTTIMAFIPLTQLEGDIGHAVGAVSLVIILCLIFSIVESKLILPAHLYQSFIRRGALPKSENRVAAYLMDTLLKYYEPLLRAGLRAPGFVITCALASLLIALSAVSSGWIKTTMLPSVADYEIEAELVAPIEATLTETQSVVSRIEAAMVQTNAQLQAQYQLPYPPLAHFYALAEAAHRVSMTAEMTPNPDNPVTLSEFVAAWRTNMDDLPVGYTLSLSATAEPEDGINIQLEGATLGNLVDAAEELKMMLSQYPGVTDIRDNYAAEQPEYRIELTDLAKSMGISLAQIGKVVRGAVHGYEMQRLQLPNQTLPVNLRYPARNRADLSALNQLKLLHNGHWLDLGQLATFTAQSGLASINRVNGMRAVNVFASNDDALATADQIMDDLEDGYLETLVARYPGLTYRVEGEARESDTIQASLIIAACLALFGVFALLALPLKSLTQAALILAVIPFSLTGVIVGHAVMGLSLSIMSFFGAIALIGVLVNDSLVLLYRLQSNMTQRDRQSDTITEVIIATCRQRFRPIFITSITTFFGVIPIIFESDPEALWLVPIALSLGVGILFGTLVTLLVLPALLVLTQRQMSPLPHTAPETPTDPTALPLPNGIHYAAQESRQ